jgi:deoxyribose-phosphate aldolase
MSMKSAETGATSRAAKGSNLVSLAPPHQRNMGTDYLPAMFENMSVNLSATERRIATLSTRRTVKKSWQAAWLIRAIECIDLTTLAGDDTPGKVERLCAKARNPLACRSAQGAGPRGLRG